MKVRKILSSDIREYEDVSFYEKLAQRFRKNTPLIPNQPFFGVITSEKAYKSICKIASQNISEYEAILHNKTVEKWMGPQGGTFNYEQLMANSKQYYGIVHADTDAIHEIRSVVSQWFLNNHHHNRNERSFITTSPRALYNAYEPTHASNGGVVWDADRRSREGRIKALKIACAMPTDYDKVGGGMRFKDGKYRNIFIDSFSNYFREVMVFQEMFQWWHQSYSDHTYSDDELSELVAGMNAKTAYAGDYKGMDMHFSIEEAYWVIDLACDVNQVSSSERAYIKMHAEEMFYADLIAGEDLIQGLHNLFSGIYPTHDLESILNFAILAYCAISQGYSVVYEPRRLRKNECFILVCGDDSIVLFGDRLTKEAVESFAGLHAKTAAAFGQEMELSKVDWGYEVITFCKKTLALSLNIRGFKRKTGNSGEFPVFKYPCLKCVHALYEPENIPDFPEKKDLVIWFCAIMDNAYGTSQWKGTCIAIIQQNPQLFCDVPVAISPETQAELNKDWWFRNYARFSLPSSPTFALIKDTLHLE